MGIIVQEVRLQSRLDSLFGAAKAALPVWLILLLSDWEASCKRMLASAITTV